MEPEERPPIAILLSHFFDTIGEIKRLDVGQNVYDQVEKMERSDLDIFRSKPKKKQLVLWGETVKLSRRMDPDHIRCFDMNGKYWYVCDLCKSPRLKVKCSGNCIVLSVMNSLMRNFSR